MTEDEARNILFESMQTVKAETGWDDGQIAEVISEMTSTYDYYDSIYVPDEELIEKIQEYQLWFDEWNEATRKRDQKHLKQLNQAAGYLMEELACLAFRCLKGFDSIKSFQSYAPQYDLIISGSTPAWFMLIKLLHIPDTSRTIIVEVKNTKDPVSDAQFSRLCSVISSKLDTTCSLGVFFTRSGASGFPSSGQNSRQRALQNSRATQVIFHAKTKKFVVVLEHSEIKGLAERGTLPRMLEAKIRDVEEASGLLLNFEENWIEIDLPPHLAQYFTNSE